MLNIWLDSGSNTCGLDFDYDMVEEDKKNDDKVDKGEEEAETEDPEGKQEGNGQEEDGSERTPTLQQDILAAISKSDVTFMSVTGRWVVQCSLNVIK